MKILENLKALLEEKSQASLAREIGISPSLLCRWLNGSRSITTEHAEAIALVTGEDFKEVFKGIRTLKAKRDKHESEQN